MFKEEFVNDLRGRSLSSRSIRRAKSIVAVVAVGVLGLTACSSPTSSGDGAEISYFMGPYAATTDASMQTLVDGFQAANPDITVSYQSAPWDSYDQKISTAAKAGDGPGLAMEYTWAKYGADGLLRPISDWVSAELLADFIPVFINPDEEFAVPDLASVRGTFHNTAIEEAAGVSGLPETFEELEDALVKIKASNPGITPLGFVSTADDIGPSYSYYLFGAGGKWIDDNDNFLMNSNESIAALTLLKDLYDRKLIEQDVTADRGAQEERFQASQTAILPTGNFFVPTLKANVPDLAYQVGSLPHRADVAPFAVGVTDYFISFDQPTESQNAASSALMTYIFDPENYVPWLVADGFLPVTKSAIEPYRQAAPDMAPFLDNLDSAKFYPGGDTRWAKVTEIMSQAVQSVLLGRTSVEEGLNSAQEQIDALPTS